MIYSLDFFSLYLSIIFLGFVLTIKVRSNRVARKQLWELACFHVWNVERAQKMVFDFKNKNNSKDGVLSQESNTHAQHATPYMSIEKCYIYLQLFYNFFFFIACVMCTSTYDWRVLIFFSGWVSSNHMLTNCKKVVSITLLLINNFSKAMQLL